MSLNTYLTFDGNCREAFEFYRSVFGGEFLAFSTFADGPPDMDVPEAQRNLVMHVSLPVGSSVLMGSDNSTHGPRLVAGNNFSIPSRSRAGSTAMRCSPSFRGAAP